MTRRLLAVLAVLAVPCFARPAPPLEGALKRIKETKSVRIAYRPDALPFSYEENGQPVGYTVDLCKRIVASLGRQLGVENLQVKWIPATSENRIELVRKREADMECGATTATLSRMEVVDFSSPVFVDATGVLVRRDVGARSLSGLGGRRIVVVAGTTNQRLLEAALKKELVTATLVPVKSRDDGIAALEGGNADAMAGDRILLAGLARKVKDASRYELLEEELGLEPYAIVLPRNDASLRLAVNRALGQIYSSEEIAEVFRRAFGPEAKLPPALLVLFRVNAYPE